MIDPGGGLQVHTGHQHQVRDGVDVLLLDSSEERSLLLRGGLVAALHEAVVRCGHAHKLQERCHFEVVVWGSRLLSGSLWIKRLNWDQLSLSASGRFCIRAQLPLAPLRTRTFPVMASAHLASVRKALSLFDIHGDGWVHGVALQSCASQLPGLRAHTISLSRASLFLTTLQRDRPE